MIGFVSKRKYKELKMKYDRLLELNHYLDYWYFRAISKNSEFDEENQRLKEKLKQYEGS